MPRLGRALVVLCTPALVVACSDGDDGGGAPTSVVVGFTTTTTAPGPSTTAVPDLHYTIDRGDSLYAIADRFCTLATEIAALNGWPEGLDHPIYPGDVILVPGPGCPVITEPYTTTTVPPNKYLASYLDEHVITDPFDQNTPDHVDWGPVCYSAYWAAQAFAVQGSSKAALLEALAPLAAVPADVIAKIDLWEPFSQQWYPIYVDVRGRIQAEHPMYPDTDTFYRILFNDTDYLQVLTAYESVGDEQFAAKYWVTDVCTSLKQTRGSTP